MRARVLPAFVSALIMAAGVGLPVAGCAERPDIIVDGDTETSGGTSTNTSGGTSTSGGMSTSGGTGPGTSGGPDTSTTDSGTSWSTGTTWDTDTDTGMTGMTWGTDTDDPTDSDSGDSQGDPDGCGPLETAVTRDCVVGEEIDSVETGDALCVAQLGEGWRWLDFHADGGWDVEAEFFVESWDTSARAWVWINDQDAECFSSPVREIIAGQPQRFGMTWQPLELDHPNCHTATCNSVIGLDEPGHDPEPGPKCNAYEGDTPCSACRPLLCVHGP